MALHLKDLMAKAESKGIKIDDDTSTLLKPWQQESVLFRENNTLNHKQTINKVETNRKQTVNRTINKPKTKKQTENKSVNKIVNTTVNKVETNRKQTVNKFTDTEGFFLLVGLQRSALMLIHEICKNNRSKISPPLTLEYIASHLNTSTKVIKTTIQRLVKKDYLLRDEFKNGRGGWTKYVIPDAIYQAILQNETVNKVETNRKQTVNAIVNTTVNKDSSSSSLLKNKTTTIQLPSEWENINFSSLYEIGFSINQLTQLYEKNLNTPEIIQESINHFAYGLENNKKFKEYNDPLNVLMGVLRKGRAWFEKNYESPQTIALRELLEQKKHEKEKRKKVEDDLYNVYFNEWLEGLTEEDKNKYLEDKRDELANISRHKNLAKTTKNGYLSEYYKNNIWEEVYKNILEN